MYESLLESNYDEITCVVLTGMGSDGAVGIDRLGNEKNVHVIAQDEKTCVVYGMPRAVANAGLVDEVLPLNRIADAIIKNVGVLNDGR
jgi:two-component system chemotaxis response regulator CheB